MNCIGVNYKTVPLAIRERYAFSEEEQREFHRRLREHCGCYGSVIISTCNRSEIYFCGEGADTLISGVEHELAQFKGLPVQELLGQIYVYGEDKALKHLFHVAGGLDSMVLGEDEILRQVKDGYQHAAQCSAVCNEINIAFQGAMGSAKSIKTNTLLSKTPVSMGTLAANRIEGFLKETGGSHILVVGITGKIGSILARNLYSKGMTHITGTSRRHGGLSGTFSDMPIPMVDFAERYGYVDDADVIVSATSGPHYTFLAGEVARALTHEKERLFVDMAVPRDMDRGIGELSGCRVLDIDDFKRAAADNNAIKLRETDKAELILTEKLEETQKSIYMSAFMERNAQGFASIRDRAFGGVFYQLKEQLPAKQLAALMEAMERMMQQ